MKEQEEKEEKPYGDLNRGESSKYREPQFGIDMSY